MHFSLPFPTALVLLTAMSMLSACDQRKLNADMLAERPTASPQMQYFIDQWNKPGTVSIPYGLYKADVQTDTGVAYGELQASYLFAEDRVIVKAVARSYPFGLFSLELPIAGSAHYTTHNGLIEYSDIRGDKAIFPEFKTPYEVTHHGDQIVLYEQVKDAIRPLFLTRDQPSIKSY